MTIRKKTTTGKIVIDLDGHEGNAFYLIGYVHKAIRQKNMRDHIINKMKAGDYTNLIKVFDRYLGDVVTLVTNQENLLKELT